MDYTQQHPHHTSYRRTVQNYKPYTSKWYNYWNSEFEKLINGVWEDGYWCSPVLYWYLNYTTIEYKASVTDQPMFRDFEWEFTKLYSEAKGFSRFSNQKAEDIFYTTAEADELGIDYTFSAQWHNYEFKGTRWRKRIIKGRNYKPLKFALNNLKVPIAKVNPRELLAKKYDKPQGIPLYEYDCKNIMMLGARQLGKSAIMVGLITYEFNITQQLHVSNKIMVGASEEKKSNDLLVKVKLSQEHLSRIGEGEHTTSIGVSRVPCPFYNRHTDAWGSGKNITAQIVENVKGIGERKKGTNNVIHHRVFRKHDAGNGLSCKLAIFEECGLFTNLASSYQSVIPTMRVDARQIGVCVFLGTGGDMKNGTVDAKKIFYNPELYNCLAFDNKWSGGGKNKKVGWFVSADNFAQNFRKDGWTDQELARSAFLQIREKNKRDMDAYNKHIVYYPLTPDEIFNDPTGNIFPVVKLQQRKTYLEANDNFLGEEVFFELDKIKMEVTCNIIKDTTFHRYIKEFPFSGDTRANAMIWEHPKDDVVYYAGCDSFDKQEKSEYTNSLGSVFIFKEFTPGERFYDAPVAEYTARPDTANEFYFNVMKLLMYYNNSKLMLESNNSNMRSFFDKYNMTYKLLQLQPTELIQGMVRNSKQNQKFGVQINKTTKTSGKELIRDWLIEDDNYKNIYSLPLLEELIQYKDDVNVDRVMALMQVMFFRTSRIRKLETEHRNTSRLNDRFFQSRIKKYTNNKRQL